jgi:hypothetical protein
VANYSAENRVIFVTIQSSLLDLLIAGGGRNMHAQRDCALCRQEDGSRRIRTQVAGPTLATSELVVENWVVFRT